MREHYFEFERTMFHSNTTFFYILLIIYFIFQLIRQLYRYIFSTVFSLEEWYQFSDVLVILLGVYGVCEVIRQGCKFWDRKFKTAPRTVNRRNLLIGLGGIAICGWVPRVLVFWENDVFWTSCYYHVFSLSYIIIFNRFCFNTPACWEPRYSSYWGAVKATVIVNILAFFGLMRATVIWIPEEQQMTVFSVHFFFTLFFTPSMVDFVMMCLPFKTRLSVKRVKGARAENLECQICMHDYHYYNRPPRILTQCGHTVCQECVKNLLKEEKGNHVWCPTCRIVNVVPEGQAHLLPKNYEAMRLITEFNRAGIIYSV